MTAQKVVMYLRISDKDRESLGESQSIQGQRQLLLNYVAQFDELSLMELEEIVDDGFSGTSFERPGMRRLLSMVKEGQVACIVVKDLSRFGRNYLEAGFYLEQVFPAAGIRFLSVGEQFDSFLGLGAAGNLEIGFRNLLYQMYSQDLSRKIRGVRLMKAQSGRYLGGRPPYGYQMDEHHRLIPDPGCQQVVNRIFTLYADGWGLTQIASQLNREGILPPAGGGRDGKGGWSLSTLSKMLEDQRYTGDSVYGRRRPTAIGSRQCVEVPKQQWVIKSHAHTALVDQALFEQVQKRRQTGKRKRPLASV